MCCILPYPRPSKKNEVKTMLTGNQDESWLGIYRNKLVHHLHGMHHSSLGCDHDLVDDNTDVVVFFVLVGMIHDCPVAESMLVSTENRNHAKRCNFAINLKLNRNCAATTRNLTRI